VGPGVVALLGLNSRLVLLMSLLFKLQHAMVPLPGEAVHNCRKKIKAFVVMACGLVASIVG
jgi:hypothetical protein